MKIEEVIGRNLLRLREARRLSQADLGRAIESQLGRSWSRQAVSAAEKGRRAFTATDLVALARVLDVSIPALVLLTDWRQGATVELGPDVHVGAQEYQERVFQDWDVRTSAHAMTRADMDELVAAVARIRDEHERSARVLDQLSASVQLAATALPAAGGANPGPPAEVHAVDPSDEEAP